MKRVLLLCDDPAAQEVAESALGAAGWAIDRAVSLAEGWHLLRTSQPDVVLADCTVLGVREQAMASDFLRSRGIGLVLMTGDPTVQRGLQRRGFTVLAKPVTAADLHDTIGRGAVAPARLDGMTGIALQMRLAWRSARAALRGWWLRVAGRLFDRWVVDYRIAGLRFTIPREITAPDVRARFLLPGYEAPERALVGRYLSPEATVLELGGCLGVVSCIINRRLADRERHVVFEAHPQLALCLTENRDRNACRFAVRNAILSRAPEGHFYARDPFIGGGSTVRLGRKMTVSTTTVERLEQETGLAFDTLVIDIEGGEHGFFGENRDLLARVRLVVVELHPSIIGAARCAQIREWLAAAGLTRRDRRGTVEAWLRSPGMS